MRVALANCWCHLHFSFPAAPCCAASTLRCPAPDPAALGHQPQGHMPRAGQVSSWSRLCSILPFVPLASLFLSRWLLCLPTLVYSPLPSCALVKAVVSFPLGSVTAWPGSWFTHPLLGLCCYCRLIALGASRQGHTSQHVGRASWGRCGRAGR